MFQKNKGILLIFSTAIISGFSIFLNYFGVKIADPYVFTGLKNGLVALILCLWLLMMSDWKILCRLSGKRWFFLLLIGVLGGAVPFLLFFKGLTLVTAAQGAFLHKMMFVYATILAVVFLKEKINYKIIGGGILILLGNALMLRFIPYEIGLGDLLISVAALLWSVETIMSKYLLKDLEPRIVMWGRMFIGSVAIFSFLVLTGRVHFIAELSFGQIGWIMITSVLLFGYIVTLYFGLKYVPVSLAMSVLLLGSVITAVLNFIFLNQGIKANELWGMASLACGAIFLLLNKKNNIKSEGYALKL